MLIEVTSSPSREDLKIISDGIKSFNQKYMPDEVVFEDDTKFTVFAKNEKGEVIGGIRATAFWNYCIIELLWLSEDTRGFGVGTKLMEAAEQHAIAKGFKYIRTETLSFQAKPFMKNRAIAFLVSYPITLKAIQQTV